MSHSQFEIPPRVVVACSNCRKRKVKCITESNETICLRCQHHRLSCQYVPTDTKRRSRGAGEPTPSKKQTLGTAEALSTLSESNPAHLGTSTPYRSNTKPATAGRQDMSSVLSPFDQEATGLQYRPPHLRSPVTPSFPGPRGPAHPYNSNTRIATAHPPIMMQPGQYQALPSSQNIPMGNPTQYNEYSVYDWSATKQWPRCNCPPGMCFCGVLP
ncbi:hypothetical protein DFH07DRAFT_765668 [Mycena maculata]|uniref:Zn(2)-C6 fungal-type domain-containing protein n=1 Tax=Mycena maculata TaxID=230809 RepID=A0AAD7NXR6_9AGAR|nr:hypothetical protein DFH07DRAFT_765668 [Mycena maculata]